MKDRKGGGICSGTKALVYLWASKVPRGYVVPSPYTNNIKIIKIIMIESGIQNIGRWLMECRNVHEDFFRHFGEKPPRAGGIAIMSDTDNTGEFATASCDNIFTTLYLLMYLMGVSPRLLAKKYGG